MCLPVNGPKARCVAAGGSKPLFFRPFMSSFSLSFLGAVRPLAALWDMSALAEHVPLTAKLSSPAREGSAGGPGSAPVDRHGLF